ncbi:MAG TPA: protein kinase [Vicinamibacterales bacterium]|nr:protein kinase [Vicinamibacterales bacterium]
MSLQSGTRLGTYEILSAIGVGGMGEVYRARDTKLGREVAVKVILQEFAADRERIARLEREARALAALNHPAIATLLGLEHADGRDFLVMELVPGDTLRERLARGPMPIETTTLIARQIAEALEAAHEKGIVHRDLKPANVKVSDDDKVKLLDFGLARAIEPPSSSSSASFANSPTVSAMTQQGVILGTASYMSPEQARGLPADHRSDVFSFGIVLFEMLAGRQPFQGDTVSDVLASVLAREPDLRALPADLHPRLTELVRRCLEKPPRRRWQAIGDVRHELESLAVNPHAPAPTGSAIASPPRPWWRRALPAALAALLTATIAGGIAWRLWPVTDAGPVSRFDVPFSEGQVLTAEMGRAVAVSPDGSLFAYSANRQIFLREANQTSIRRLFDNPGLPFISNLTFSPDGKQLVFWSSERNILRLSVTAGAPVKVCDITATVTGFSWVGDDLWFSTTDSIMRVPAAGGTPVTVLKGEGNETLSGMTLLPDRRHVLFTVATGDAPDRWEHARIVVQPIDGGQRAVLVEPGFDGRYLPGGYLLYSLGGVTFAVRFDASSLRVSGASIAVIDGVRRGGSLVGLGSAQYGVSNAGTLVYVPGPVAATTSPQLYLAFFDPAGTPQSLKIPAGTYTHPRLSPNGHLVAYGVDDERETSVWIADVAGVTGPRRLSIGGKDRYPVWADDTRVVFQSDRGGDLGLFIQRADGSGSATRLTTAAAGVSHIAQAVSPDGQVLLIDVVDKDKTALVEYRFSDQSLKSLAGITSISSTSASFSPDGKWLAYTTAQPTGTAKVFVQPYPPTSAVFQISKSNEDGHHSAWSSDGSRLFYTPGPGAVLMSARLARGAGIEIVETTLVARPFTNGPPSIERPYDTSPGIPKILGLTATLSTQPGAAPVNSMSVVLNWLEEVKQKVK